MKHSTRMCSRVKHERLSRLPVWLFLVAMILTPVKAFFEDIGAPNDNTNLISSGTMPTRSSVDDNRPIANTNSPAKFRTQRYGADFTYTLTGFVPNRTYQIDVGFAEIWSNACNGGVRRFNVLVNGAVLSFNLDVAKETGGCERAHVETYFTEATSAGKFDIRFVGVQQNAIVSWIEVQDTSQPSSRKWIDLQENESYTARHECSFVQAGNKFYLFGGREDPRRLEAYDYTTNKWSVQASVPYGQDVNHFQATEFQGLIWVIGSYKDNNFPKETPSDQVLVYDPGNNVWMRGPMIPEGRRRGSAGLVAYDGKFYTLGGTTSGHRGGFVAWFDEYDPHTGRWRTLPDAPHMRDHFHAAVVAGKLYAIGGRQSSSSSRYTGNPVKEVDVYDFRQGRWLTSGLPDDLPNPRSGAAVAVFDGKIMIMGGESDAQPMAYREVDALDTNTGKWSTLAPMNHARHGIQAIVSGQGVFVTAGSPVATNGRQKLMEVYNQDLPSGTNSVAGVLSAPSEIELQSRQSSDVVLRHVGGNEGVFIHSIALTGSDSSKFRFLGDSDQILIDRNDQARLKVEYTGTDNNARAQLVVTYSGGRTESISLVGKVQQTSGSSFFLDAGKSDQSFINNGSSYYTTSAQIKGTSTPEYFQSHRWRDGASFKYSLGGFTSSKTYEIKFGWAEIFWRTCTAGGGARVFHVVVNSRVVELNLDVFGEVGCETALVKSHRLSPDSGGKFDIEFVPVVSNAMVSFIEITEVTGTGPPPPPPPPPPPTLTPGTQGRFVLINAGDSRETNPKLYGSGTQTYSGSDLISGTTLPQQYFQSHRFAISNFKYDIDGLDKNKVYEVELGFAELYGPNCVVGKRIFDIKANGRTIESNVDVFAAKGCRAAYILSYNLTPDSQGGLELEFVRKVENPMVSMIKLEETTGTISQIGSQSVFINAGTDGENTSYLTESDTRVDFRPNPVADTPTPQYYQRSRFSKSSFGYKIDGFDKNKVYTVEMGFAEMYLPSCRKGKRIFDIAVNGNVVKSGLDVFKAKGCETAYILSYNLSPSSSGSFEIRFIRRRKNPMVAFIHIKEAGSNSPPAPAPTQSPPPPQSTGSQSFKADSGDSREDMSAIFPSYTKSSSIAGSFTISNAPDPRYFRSHRYADTSFGYKIKNFNKDKTYKIDLWFAEQFTPNCVVGKRVFDVIVNGVEKTSNLDVFAKAGCQTAHLESYTLKPSSSGEFEIIFAKQVENPMVSYIEILEVVNSALELPPWVTTPGPSPTASNAPPPTPSPPSSNELNIDAGGMSEDTSVVGGLPSFQYGNTASPNIANTGDQTIFRTIRYGADFSYTLEGFAPNASHEIVFGFAELWDPYCSSGGNRIFNVLVNGQMVVQRLDVYTSAGGQCKKAHFIQRTLKTDGQGRFKIRFVSVKDVAMVSLIRIKTL